MFGEEKFNHFEEWFSTQKRGIFPKDFLYFDGNSFPFREQMIIR